MILDTYIWHQKWGQMFHLPLKKLFLKIQFISPIYLHLKVKQIVDWISKYPPPLFWIQNGGKKPIFA